MVKLSDVMAGAFSALAEPTPPGPVPSLATDGSPIRMKTAIQRARQLEKPWLTTSQFVDLIELFENNTRAVDSYSSLEVEDVDIRKTWVKKKLGVVDWD
jgi:hypothetical protein